MKKVILLLTLAAGCYLGLNSFENGAAANGYDCTGAEKGLGNPTGCATGMGTGCHSTIANPDVWMKLKVDSAGSPINFYTPGKTYTVTVTGKHQIAATFPKFGFQVGVINGPNPDSMALSAGSLQATGLPFGVRYKAANLANYRINILEQAFPISATTGTGDSTSTYVETFTWTAPVVGPDTVSVWGVFLAANGSGTASGDVWDTTHILITRRPIPASIDNRSMALNVKLASNPVYNNLDILFANSIQAGGTYSVSIYDMLGKKIAAKQVLVSGASDRVSLDASNWAPGMYVAVVEGESGRTTLQVVKN